MPSANYFNRLVENYVRTPSGQKIVKQYKKDVINGKRPSAGTGILSKKTMELMGKKMEDILYAEIANEIPSFPRSAISSSVPKEMADGNYKISLSIAPKALHRESLWQEEYPNGVDDIVMLFTKGYRAKASVYGMWHGNKVYSKTYREPNDFMQRAVNTFNSFAVDGAKAEPGDKYK